MRTTEIGERTVLAALGDDLTGQGRIRVSEDGLVTCRWDAAHNAYSFNVNGDWNSVKQANIQSKGAESLILNDFVDVRVDLAGNEDSSVFARNIKRAAIVTGHGDDDVHLSLLTTGKGWFNSVKVDGGSGNDDISVSRGNHKTAGNTHDGNNDWAYGLGPGVGKGMNDGSVSRITIDGGRGRDDIDLSPVNALHTKVIGGTGNDVMRASEGADQFVFRFYDTGRDQIYGFDKGEDVLSLFGTSDDWRLVHASGNSYLTNGHTQIVVHDVQLTDHDIQSWF